MLFALLSHAEQIFSYLLCTCLSFYVVFHERVRGAVKLRVASVLISVFAMGLSSWVRRDSQLSDFIIIYRSLYHSVPSYLSALSLSRQIQTSKVFHGLVPMPRGISKFTIPLNRSFAKC